MKVLITSGGTKVAIDKVRSITNMSHGTLGSKLAKDALERGAEVIFFCAEGSKTPMSLNLDIKKASLPDCKRASNDLFYFWEKYSYRYTEISYKSFEDYESGLQKIISLHKPDVIILAAAVSDYGVESPVEGKIRTQDQMAINLYPLPKVISSVRTWAGEDAFIVGFKLLVGVSNFELLKAARESLTKNKLNIVCANDLNTILSGNHQINIVSSSGADTVAVPSSLWDKIEARIPNV